MLKGEPFTVKYVRMETLLDVLAAKGVMTFAEFMRESLYHPGLGYYTREDRTRVGTRRDADFYTAESIGPVFAELVAEAAWRIAAPWHGKDVEFVELGAEPEGENVAERVCPPFGSSVALSLGNDIPDDAPVVLFSNELFDAQPFHRVVRSGGKWRECGVVIKGGRAQEVLMDALSWPIAAMADRFDGNAPDGYRMDLPIESEVLMQQIAARKNVVAVIAFDYGYDWSDVYGRRPNGSARAYRSHTLCSDLLADPGEQDLTCNVCWDGLENVLKSAGFANVATERQEAFFMHRSAAKIEEIVKSGDIVRNGKLRELIHPMRMGEVFQVLTAVRQ
jgi:SAM-dependent MidA family methyltransferase